jgi:hypothetical protein
LATVNPWSNELGLVILETEWRGWVYSTNIKVRNADRNFIIQWAIQTRGTIQMILFVLSQKQQSSLSQSQSHTHLTGCHEPEETSLKDALTLATVALSNKELVMGKATVC